MILKKASFLYITIIIYCGFTYAQNIDSLYEVATWQGFRSVAVTFTFDDNTPGQTSVMLPIFDSYGYKMTFFPVINWGPNWTALKTAAENGHEVGSHTVSHTDLSTLTTEQQRNEFKNSKETIESKIPGQPCLSIAYPYCVPGNTSLCNEYYLAARTCSGSIVPRNPSNFMQISSIICGSEGQIQTKDDFVSKANSAVRSKGWVVFLIHAIDEDAGYSPTDSDEIKGALEYYSANDDKFWIATFGEVARYIKERNNISVNEKSSDDSLIVVTVSDTLDNTVFNVPLTIRRQVPDSWISAHVRQGGSFVNSQLLNDNDRKYIMFDIIPDSGEIEIVADEITNLANNLESQPHEWELKQNYPNPFNPETTITFQIAEKGAVSLKMFDILGKEVAVLLEDYLLPGSYSLKYNGTNLKSGVYIYQLNCRSFSSAKKLILLK